MTEDRLDREVLEHVGVDRREFVRRTIMGSAFAVPLVASFPMSAAAESSVSSACANQTEVELEIASFRDAINEFVADPEVRATLNDKLHDIEDAVQAGDVGRLCRAVGRFERKVEQYRDILDAAQPNLADDLLSFASFVRDNCGCAS